MYVWPNWVLDRPNQRLVAFARRRAAMFSAAFDATEVVSSGKWDLRKARVEGCMVLLFGVCRSNGAGKDRRSTRLRFLLTNLGAGRDIMSSDWGDPCKGSSDL